MPMRTLDYYFGKKGDDAGVATVLNLIETDLGHVLPAKEKFDHNVLNTRRRSNNSVNPARLNLFCLIKRQMRI